MKETFIRMHIRVTRKQRAAVKKQAKEQKVSESAIVRSLIK